MEIKVLKNKEKSRFEANVGDDCAFVDFFRKGDTMFLTHTEVPPAMQGKGIGSQLISKTLQQIAQEELKVVSRCPFVTNYLKRHPEYNYLVA